MGKKAPFQGNSLCFCRRCGLEMAGRTLDDLQPMTDEEREQFMGLDEDAL